MNDLEVLKPLEFELSNQEWKRMVKEAIRKANEKELKAEIILKYNKLMKSELVGEEFGRKYI